MSESLFTGTMVEMTWKEIEAAVKQKAIALLPVGVIEEHGPHLGLAVDIYAPCRLARNIKSLLESRGVRTLIAPPYYWGNIGLTSAFPGSFSFKPEIIQESIFEIIACLKRWGVDYVFILNWHAEYKHNLAAIEAVKQARASGIKAFACLTEHEALSFKLNPASDYLITQPNPPERGSAAKYPDLHAGSLETAFMLEYYPDQVRQDLISSLKPTHCTLDDLKNLIKKDGDPRKLIKDGYFGDPAGFDRQYCRMYLEAKSASYADLIETELKKAV